MLIIIIIIIVTTIIVIIVNKEKKKKRVKISIYFEARRNSVSEYESECERERPVEHDE